MEIKVTNVKQENGSIFVDGIVNGVIVKGAEGFVSRFNALAHDAVRQSLYLEGLLKAHVLTPIEKEIVALSLVSRVKNFVAVNRLTICLSAGVCGVMQTVEFILKHLVK